MEKTSEQQETRVNDIKNSGKGNLLQKISKRIAKELHNKTVEDLREGFDGLFGKGEMTPERLATLKKFNLEGLLLSDEERIVDSEKKVGRISQYWQDLAHFSLGVYVTLKPASVRIEMPETSVSYKFIFVEPGIMMGDQFTLMAGTEGFHANIWARYKENNKNDTNKHFFEVSKGSEQVNILGGGWIDLDVENKHIRFYGSSGSYAYVSDKIIEWATKSLRDQGRTTTIEMDYRGKTLKE